MKLPKLYAPVWIEFDSLRSGIGGELGVVFDIDTRVRRKCMRVLHGDSWVWQIVNYNSQEMKVSREYDQTIAADQEILLDYGPNIDAEIL